MAVWPSEGVLPFLLEIIMLGWLKDNGTATEPQKQGFTNEDIRKVAEENVGKVTMWATIGTFALRLLQTIKK